MEYTPKVGEITQGVVVEVHHDYAIMLFDEGYTGLLHVSEAAHSYVRNFLAYCRVGNIYGVKVIGVDEETGRVKVSVKQLASAERRQLQKSREVDPAMIDFTALGDKLSLWLEKERQGAAS